MPLESYIPSEVTFDQRPVPDVMVITLYEPDGVSPHGSLTGPTPIDADSAGPLIFVGRRDGKEWRVTLPSISVRSKSALGCEYAIRGPVQREVLRELGEGAGPHQKGLEERFDIR